MKPLSNYAAGTRTKIEIRQDTDNQYFIAIEIEQDGYNSAEWTETKNLVNVDELTVYLKKIINH